MSQKIHIKLQYNNEFRRFVIEPESKFDDIKQKISTILNISTPFSIRYQDEESEWITIDSDGELQTGIELSPAILRLQILDSASLTPNTPNPVQKSEQTVELDDEPKWKKYKKWRKENSEKGGDNDCGKWRRKKCNWRNENSECKKENSEKTSDENDDCGKWRRKRCNWRNENSDIKKENSDKGCGDDNDCGKWRKKRCNWRNENSDKACENNANSDQPVEGGDCSKWKSNWKRSKKCGNENPEQTGEQNDCQKWKKYRKNGNENCDGKGSKGRRGKWGFNVEIVSDSESIEDKTVEELNKEIKSLKEEIKLIMEKKKGLWQEVIGLKEQIKNLRQNDGAKEDIVKLREQIVEKKKTCQGYQLQVVNSKNRIWKLKSALEVKNV